jgi:hypothetical protein
MMSGTGALRQFVPKAVRQHFQKRNALWASRAGRGRAARTMADSDAGVGSGGTDAHVRDDGRHFRRGDSERVQFNFQKPM